jgi:hypothetical protein
MGSRLSQALGDFGEEQPKRSRLPGHISRLMGGEPTESNELVVVDRSPLLDSEAVRTNSDCSFWSALMLRCTKEIPSVRDLAENKSKWLNSSRVTLDRNETSSRRLGMEDERFLLEGGVDC